MATAEATAANANVEFMLRRLALEFGRERLYSTGKIRGIAVEELGVEV